MLRSTPRKLTNVWPRGLL